MAYKTPNRTSEYIRQLMALSPNQQPFADLIEYADKNSVPILLPESVAFLSQILRVYKPKKILEIGTAIGYSGSVMLKESQAKLITIDMNEELVNIAKENFIKNGFADRVKIFCGDACEIIPIMEGEFDFIFVDGPKTRYIDFYPYLKKMLKKDGILLCDNILFNGMVTGEQQIGKNKNTIVEKLDLFLKTLFMDDDFASSILPVGDGLSFSIKTKD